jgi:hypothetical protein
MIEGIKKQMPAGAARHCELESGDGPRPVEYFDDGIRRLEFELLSESARAA